MIDPLDLHRPIVRHAHAPTPGERVGVGLLLENRSDLVLRNPVVTGFARNLVLRGCRNVTVLGGDLSGSLQPVLHSTEQYDERDWLDIFDPDVWRSYGAGIVLEDCRDCRVIGVRAGSAVNGAMLINSHGCRVAECDFSGNTGWGIWLWGSHGNLITRNNCDWCVRCEDPERFSAGGDSAGIMLSHDNCRNTITHNSLRYGGDGFFLNGLRVAPSEHNLIAFNDASHSPHNAFESSFSGWNRFVGNIASNSRFGFWCGFSHHNEFVGNLIENCLEWGIAIEHGHDNLILGNEIRRARRGIVLFQRSPVHPSDPSGATPAPASVRYVLEGNVVEGSEIAVTVSQTESVQIAGSVLRGPIALEAKRGSRKVECEWTDLLGEVSVDDGSLISCRACHGPAEVPPGCTIEDASPSPRGEPHLPVSAALADPQARLDHAFRWFDRRRQTGVLVGTAEV